MRHIIILVILSTCLISLSGWSQDRPPYLELHKDLAIQEMNRSGIPASIILAQAIVESAWGRATLAQAANNHFGIKCKSTWVGASYFLEDDDYDTEGNLTESCFRAYTDVLSSFRDHTDFLMQGERYQELFALSKNDYSGWAYGLKKCGYATDPAYAEKLIKKVEDYRLFEFDVQEVVMEAPSFEIPYHQVTETKVAEIGEIKNQSLIIADDFGLIATRQITPATIAEEIILESPTYNIEKAVLEN